MFQENVPYPPKFVFGPSPIVRWPLITVAPWKIISISVPRDPDPQNEGAGLDDLWGPVKLQNVHLHQLNMSLSPNAIIFNRMGIYPDTQIPQNCFCKRVTVHHSREVNKIPIFHRIWPKGRTLWFNPSPTWIFMGSFKPLNHWSCLLNRATI